MRTQGTPPRQAYNAQTAVNDRQIILAAEITIDAPDFGHLAPMLDTTLSHLERHGVSQQPEAVVADAGYWHNRQIEQLTDRGIEVLIPPDGNMREGKRPGWEHGFYEAMRRKLTSDRGRKLYAQRKITVEPVYGQIKYNRRIDRFMRRGRAAARSEWRLVTATHNLLKLHPTGSPTPPDTHKRACRKAIPRNRQATLGFPLIPKFRKPRDQGVASAWTGGRALGHGCDRRDRRPQMRDGVRATLSPRSRFWVTLATLLAAAPVRACYRSIPRSRSAARMRRMSGPRTSGGEATAQLAAACSAPVSASWASGTRTGPSGRPGSGGLTHSLASALDALARERVRRTRSRAPQFRDAA